MTDQTDEHLSFYFCSPKELSSSDFKPLVLVCVIESVHATNFEVKLENYICSASVWHSISQMHLLFIHKVLFGVANG